MSFDFLGRLVAAAALLALLAAPLRGSHALLDEIERFVRKRGEASRAR